VLKGLRAGLHWLTAPGNSERVAIERKKKRERDEMKWHDMIK
jgi:hypothetical protein